MSTKGGVGKSTMAKFLSITLGEMGKTVYIIDLCQNGSVSTGFMKERDLFTYTTFDWLTSAANPSEVIQQFEESNIYYIPSDETIDDYEDWVNKKIKTPMKRLQSISEKIEPLKKLFDYVILDTHPSENSDLVAYSIVASDYCLIPLEVDLDSKLGTERSVQIINDFKEYQDLDYGIVPNKVSRTNGKLKQQLEQFKQDLINKGVPKEKILSHIRYSDIVPSTKNERVMLNEYKNKYAVNIMNDFRQVTNEVITALQKNEVTING